MFEKLSGVLKKIDLQNLDRDISSYTKYERMRQVWTRARNGRRLFTTDLNHLYKQANDFLEEAYAIAVEKRITTEKIYTDYAAKLETIRSLAKYYGIFSGELHIKFTSVGFVNELNAALFFNSGLKSRIFGVVGPKGENVADRGEVKRILLTAIQTMAIEIDKYMKDFYHEMALDVFGRYRATYQALATCREKISHNMLTTSLDARASSPTLVSSLGAVQKLLKLKDLATDAGKKTEADMCYELFTYVQM